MLSSVLSFAEYSTYHGKSYDNFNGKCGKNVTFVFDEETQILIIKGKGRMYDYPVLSKYIPWQSYSDSILGVVFGDKVTTVEAGAFGYCDNLTVVSLGKGITEVGKEAFDSDNNLVEIMCGKKLKIIKNSAFYGCNNLKKFKLANSITTIEKYAFYGYNSLNCSLPTKLKKLGGRAFENCHSIKKITITKGVAKIPYESFKGCSGLKKVNFADANTVIAGNVPLKYTSVKAMHPAKTL